MAENIGNRFRKAWNAFLNRDPTPMRNIGISNFYRPDRKRLSRGYNRTMVASVYNRIALDVAAIDIRHVQLDDQDRFIDYVDSYFDDCLSIETNIDQTPRDFIQDVVMSLFDDGAVAIVPIDTTGDVTLSSSWDILSMRTGQIIDWYPQYVKVRVYNDRKGIKEDLVLHKRNVAIIQNPFYAVMNEPNSTLQRLVRKLSLLDAVDEQSSSGKLDLIIQLPYSTRTEVRRKDALRRREEIENQLSGTKYGVAYIDASEHVTQLNRSVENNLLKQVEYLTNLLFSQLNITQSILDGTADEKTMLNYMNRTIEPIIAAITDEFKRKFITKTARTQKKSVMYFNDPFKLVPVSQIAEIADKFTRNEIFTSNEIRQIVGVKPSDDPKADELRNKNLSQSSAEIENQNEEEYEDAEW